MTIPSIDIIGHVRGVDSALIADMARRATGIEGLEIGAWDVQPLTDIDPMTNPGNGGVYRVAGTGRDRATMVPWSLVVKALKNPAGMVMPGGHVIQEEGPFASAGFGYWKREYLAFESGALDSLPGDLHAPRYYGSTHPSDRAICLWMEEIADASEPRWPMERYRRVARQLGQFNGAYLAGLPIPDAPWAATSSLRSWLSNVVAMIVAFMQDPGPWSHPLVRDAFPRPVRERLMALWSEHESLLDALDRLPRTFCHLDAYRSNLMLRRGVDGQDETVALDWSMTAVAAVGEELTPLIVASMLLGHVPAAQAAQLEADAFAGYMDGLRHAGWTGDEQLVRYGYTASAALRYAYLSAGEILRATFDTEQAAIAERQQRRPFTEIQAARAELACFLLDRGDEARDLARLL